ncbi:MAG: aminotransferase class IV [Oligoflexia bacterium]|nr:aminotransferase class IV [Oligoflexia bacterium]
MTGKLSKFLLLNGVEAPYQPFSEFLGRSAGLFETMRFINSSNGFFCRGFRLHQQRFAAGLSALQLGSPGTELLCSATAAALRRLAGEAQVDFKVRWFVTGDSWGITAEPYTDAWGSATNTGIKTVLFRGQRARPELKLLDAATSLAAAQYAEEQYAHEALLVDGSGNLTEGAWSSFFWVDGGERVYTAANNVLPGVSRQLVLNALHAAQRDSSAEEVLRDAKEAFITQATRGVVPVTEIAGKMIAHGRPGRMSMKAKQAYLRTGQAEDAWL